MYKVICPECGYHRYFSEVEVDRMQRQRKDGRIEYGMPKKIHCGSCQVISGKQSICKVIKL